MSFLVNIHGNVTVYLYLGLPIAVPNLYKDGWLAMDASGSIYAYTEKPMTYSGDTFWTSNNELSGLANEVAYWGVPQFEERYSNDWQNTLMRISDLEEWK